MTSQVFSLRLLLSEIFFLHMYNIQKYMCSVTSERVCVCFCFSQLGAVRLQ